MAIENLVIVESPAKAKTIERFLGKDYTVKSSFGHIRDLAKKNLGIDVEGGFAPQYIVPADKKKIVKELKKLAGDSNMVWLATDEDREGEAIAWHLFEELGLDSEKTRRIVFHEITKDAIVNALENSRHIDTSLVNAQQARRVLDRLVGFELSPLLWKKVKPALSAGRVQSVAVKLIVEREREIQAFTPKKYFRVTGTFLVPSDSGKPAIIKAELSRRMDSLEQAEAFLDLCMDAEFSVDQVEKKPLKKNPAPPFTTSTLQQEASRKLGFSVNQTMSVAQRLYE
ncbi:MAG: DNA topoisomerase, partial [Robiginitalea sp.]|nr:DNA topoisomerase [Robiginitalea sp.]